MTTLTNRSRIQIRYTTSPSDMGYDGCPTAWRAAAPDFIGSPRCVLLWLSGLSARMGSTYYRYELTHRGRIVQRDDVFFAAQ